MSTATRVIKNTGFLYIKMGITVFVTLYTTRLVLASLGAADFGIFNIVGGAIGMLGFLNSTLANATQRFMSYAEGRNDLEEKKKIFNISLILHLMTAITTLIMLLAVMPVLFGSILNIDTERIYAAKMVYFSVIASTMLTILNVPYDAVMNAHENMLYYSIIGVVESLLKLAVAFVCINCTGDKLLVYSIMMACIPLLTLTVMKAYCHNRYKECDLHIFKYWDAKKAREMVSFSGWNFLTAVTSLFTYQGIGLVLNHFFGTQLNAAHAVASQLKGQLSSLSVTMLKALNPVIVKNAGANNTESMNSAIMAGCKYSTLLIILLAIPSTVEMPFILGVWLEEVPEWAITFCNMQLALTIITQMANPVATAIYANGRIARYTVWKSITNILPVILVYVGFMLGCSPIWLYIPMIAVWAIGGNIIVLHYAQKNCSFSKKEYLRQVIFPLLSVIAIMYVGALTVSVIFEESILRFFITTTVTSTLMVLSLWKTIMTEKEKKLIIMSIPQMLIREIKNK